MTRPTPLLLALLLACGGPGAQHADAPPPDADPFAHVVWAPVQPAGEIVVVTLAAATVPGPAGRAELSPPADALLGTWSVRPGDEVRAGQELARLVSPSWAATHDRARQGREVVAAVEAQLALGVASRRDLEEARAATAEDAARVAAVGQELVVQGTELSWRSPRAGRVQALRAQRGEAVGPGATALVLVTPDETWVEVHLPDRYDAVAGRPRLTFHPGSGAAPTAHTLVAEGPAYDAATRTRPLWFAPVLPAPLAQGLGGRADLVVDAAEGVLAVPREAVTRVDGGSVVYARRSPLEPVGVEVLGRTPTGLAVRSDALSASDEVATRGLLQLKAAGALGEGDEP